MVALPPKVGGLTANPTTGNAVADKFLAEKIAELQKIQAEKDAQAAALKAAKEAQAKAEAAAKEAQARADAALAAANTAKPTQVEAPKEKRKPKTPGNEPPYEVQHQIIQVGEHVWEFTHKGKLTFPDGTQQTTAATNSIGNTVTTFPAYKGVCVDDGVEVSLDNIAVKLNTTGPRSLQFKTVSGTLSVNITGDIYWAKGDYTGNWSANYWSGNTLNSTWQQIFTWSFPWAGDVARYMVQDLTNRRYYRITLSIGQAYKNNFIVMERLV